MDKTAFVTGASAGIGEATARALLAAGYRVFAGARRLDRMAGLAAAGATLLKLDLTDDVRSSRSEVDSRTEIDPKPPLLRTGTGRS